MSGIDLRKAAVAGDSELVKEYIIQRCNPCSVDEYGLSALHYAVWNGHIECVKLLACNTQGVDVYGKRARSMELMSTMNYTGESEAQPHATLTSSLKFNSIPLFYYM